MTPRIVQLFPFLTGFELIFISSASFARESTSCQLMFLQKPPIQLNMGLHYNSAKKSLEIKAIKSRFGVLEKSINKLVNFFIGGVLKRGQLSKITRRFLEDTSADPYFLKLSRAFGFQIDLAVKSKEDLAKKIPKENGLIIVANHPRNGTDGIAIAATLSEFRPDIKIYMTRLLEDFPGMPENAFFLDTRDPKKFPEALRYNLQQKQELVKHLESGGSILIFPSGENSLKKNMSDTYPMDPEWKMMVTSLITKYPETKILPVFVGGSSSHSFHYIKQLKPKFISNLFVPMFHLRELANNINSTFQLAFGTPYTGAELLKLFPGKLPNLMEYIRAETHLLRGRLEKATQIAPLMDPLIDPISKKVLALEYSKMRLLVSDRGINVYLAQGQQIPQTLNELGRIREKVFRTVNEGTGKSQDNDVYDNYYYHMIAVDTETNSILGAYRLGLVDKVVDQLGPQALYNTTLFSFNQLLTHELYHSIELGRSIVDPEAGPKYKRALDTIWKGIATYLSENPQYTHLIGPVSMSNSYSSISKQLIVRYFLINHLSPFANQVQPRDPFSFESDLRPEINNVVDMITDIKQLHRLVRDIDGDGLPTLFMSYAKLGAKYLAFNTDPLFNSLDGLIVVDVHAAPREGLLKYFESKEVLDKYLKGPL